MRSRITRAAYGECGYGTSCTISVASSGRVSLDITPTLAGSCTIAPDTVTVRSNSAAGYTLQLASASASTALRGTKGGSLPAASGSITAPAALAANTWGYRLEGGVFGTGGSSASNIAIPSTTFAGVTASTNPVNIKVRTTAAAQDITSVLYGVCASSSIAADEYSSSVTYTAVTN